MTDTTETSHWPRRRPLADKVRDAIAADLILNGAVSPGEFLPSEAELCERYSISRVTLRSSMRSLQDLGLLRPRHGVGWMVLSRPLTENFERLGSFTSYSAHPGKPLSLADVSFAISSPNDDVASSLGLAPGNNVIEVNRIALHGGIRTAKLVDYIRGDETTMASIQREFEFSLIEVLLEMPEFPIAYSDAQVEPAILDEPIAQELDVAPGSIATHLSSVTYDDNGRALTYGLAWLLPEHYRLVVRRRPYPLR
ncbi:GntR family transcriptional regulator [Streptomyces sp. CLV115]|uniref:GntR family transcriptional regulator n=1 Tax=Streptomyces sp. CLV115 TaxID=3138502 RepID=UPI00313AF64B